MPHIVQPFPSGSPPLRGFGAQLGPSLLPGERNAHIRGGWNRLNGSIATLLPTYSQATRRLRRATLRKLR
jgi:hypothetical protein